MRFPDRLAFPLLIFVAGLAAGAWLPMGSRVADSSAGRRGTENATTAAPATEAGRAFASDEEMLSAIMSALAEEMPLRRTYRLHELLAGLGPAELAVLFGRAVQVEDRDRRNAVLEPLLARWLALDPAAASAAVRPYRDRFRAMMRVDWSSVDTAVSQAWARALPEPAFQEALAATHGSWVLNTAFIAINALSDGDPARQLGLLARLPATHLREDLCEDAIKTLADTDSAAAEAGLDLLTDPLARARLQAEILGKLTGRDPAAGLARLAALAPDLTPGIGGMRLVSAVLREAAQKDVATALDAAAALPEELRTQAVGAVLVNWAGDHPAEALAWASANGVDVTGATAIGDLWDDGSGEWTTLIGTLLFKDRENTLDWVRAQPASPERDAMLMQGMWFGTSDQRLELLGDLTPEARTGAVEAVIRGFKGTDAAAAWVQSLPPGELRTAAVGSLVLNQANSAPESLDTLAGAWPPGPERDAALRSVVIAEHDPLRALDFARSVSDGTQRERAFEYILPTWLNRDEAAARAWLAVTTEVSAEVKRVILREFTGK